MSSGYVELIPVILVAEDGVLRRKCGVGVWNGVKCGPILTLLLGALSDCDAPTFMYMLKPLLV